MRLARHLDSPWTDISAAEAEIFDRKTFQFQLRMFTFSLCLSVEYERGCFEHVFKTVFPAIRIFAVEGIHRNERGESRGSIFVRILLTVRLSPRGVKLSCRGCPDGRILLILFGLLSLSCRP